MAPAKRPTADRANNFCPTDWFCLAPGLDSGNRRPFVLDQSSLATTGVALDAVRGPFLRFSISRKQGDVLSRLIGWQVGLHDALGFGKAALQADHQSEILPHPSIGPAARIGAAQPSLPDFGSSLVSM